MSYKKLAIGCLMVGLIAGCSTSGQQDTAGAPSYDAGLASYKGIKAFKEACLATAPSFSSGIAVAKRYGVRNFLPLGEAQMGMVPDNSLSFQVEPNKECSVTTPNYTGNRAALRAQFIDAVSAATGQKISSTKVPFTADLNGTRFIFMHDTKGGEAFVILRAR